MFYIFYDHVYYNIVIYFEVNMNSVKYKDQQQ